MFLKQLYLTLRYFRPTIVLVIGAGVISLYLDITPFAAFALTVFLTFLQPFIDKLREVGRDLEREARENPRFQVHEYAEPLPPFAERERNTNWRLWLSYLLRPTAVVAGLLALVFLAIYIYLYFRF